MFNLQVSFSFYIHLIKMQFAYLQQLIWTGRSLLHSHFIHQIPDTDFTYHPHKPKSVSKFHMHISQYNYNKYFTYLVVAVWKGRLAIRKSPGIRECSVHSQKSTSSLFRCHSLANIKNHITKIKMLVKVKMTWLVTSKISLCSCTYVQVTACTSVKIAQW